MYISPLFPIALGHSKMDRTFTSTELECIERLGQSLISSIGNSTTQNNSVLDDPEMINIKTWIKKELDYYIDKVNPFDRSKLDLYFTQSWINFSKPGEFHHSHTHRNSYISGVFYIDANINQDCIIFKNLYNAELGYEPLHLTEFNMEDARLSINTGELILFPSRLTHSVPPNERNQTRISLSFNTFFRGEIGDIKKATNLLL